MKQYENCFRNILPSALPLIMRIDGHCFHNFCRGMQKPFDLQFIEMMNTVAIALCEQISNTKFAYLQSDEISLLIYNGIDQEPWFGNVLAKLASISASIATATAMKWKYDNNFKPNVIVTFDSRAFILPEHEIVNYVIWRQNDWARNSVQMLARSLYSHKALENKSIPDMHEMIHAKGQNWANLPNFLKNGRCIEKQVITYEVNNEHIQGMVTRPKWVVNNDIPIFAQDRDSILQMVK